MYLWKKNLSPILHPLSSLLPVFTFMCRGWTCGGQRTTRGESVVFPACRSQGLDSGLQIWQLAPLPSEPSHFTTSIFKKKF